MDTDVQSVFKVVAGKVLLQEPKEDDCPGCHRTAHTASYSPGETPYLPEETSHPPHTLTPYHSGTVFKTDRVVNSTSL